VNCPTSIIVHQSIRLSNILNDMFIHTFWISWKVQDNKTQQYIQSTNTINIILLKAYCTTNQFNNTFDCYTFTTKKGTNTTTTISIKLNLLTNYTQTQAHTYINYTKGDKTLLDTKTLFTWIPSTNHLLY